jgi:hypothetical protein
MPDTPLYPVEIRYNVRIPVRDGLELSANLFMPAPREPDEKLPALLEMIPYRKDDWRYIADHQRMTYFAQRGCTTKSTTISKNAATRHTSARPARSAAPGLISTRMSNCSLR